MLRKFKVYLLFIILAIIYFNVIPNNIDKISNACIKYLSTNTLYGVEEVFTDNFKLKNKAINFNNDIDTTINVDVSLNNIKRINGNTYLIDVKYGSAPSVKYHIVLYKGLITAIQYKGGLNV